MTMAQTPIEFAADGRDLWDRQPGESEKMFSRYTQYQLLGRKRSARLVAEEIDKSPSYVSNVGHRYRWRERAQAWDAEQDRLFLDKLNEERKRMVDEHLALSRSMMAKVAERLASLDPADLSPTDISRWSQVLTQIQRQALGEPDRVTVSGTPGGHPIEVAAVSADPVERARQFEALRSNLERTLADPIADVDPAELLDDDDD